MNDILDIIRARLLSFQSEDALRPTLAEIVGASSSYAGSDGQVFLTRAPSDLDPDTMWVVLRFIDERGAPIDGRVVSRAVLEFEAYGHGPAFQDDVMLAVDIAVEAWLSWMHIENDLIIARQPYGRIEVPYTNAQNPGDRDLNRIRILFPFTVAPQYLTQYTNHTP
jgi:hypothetical protein